MGCQAPGDRLWLDLDDMGVSGHAEVTGVKTVSALAGLSPAPSPTATRNASQLSPVGF